MPEDECAQSSFSQAQFTSYTPGTLSSIVLTGKPLVHGRPTCSLNHMRHPIHTNAKLASVILAASLILSAQERNPTQKPPVQTPQAQTITPVPLYRIEVVERTTPAVNYLHRTG